MFKFVYRCLILCFVLLCSLSFTVYPNKFNGLSRQYLCLTGKSRQRVHVSENPDPLEQFMLVGDNYISQSKDVAFILNKHIGSTDDIVKLINERAVARFNQDYDEADRIKEELHQIHGVEIQDSKGMWFSTDGRSGNIKGHSQSSSESITPVMPIRCVLSAEHIQQQVELRTQYRRQWKYYDADKIRDELAAAGVELLDQSNEWRAFDGSMRGQQSHDRLLIQPT